MEYAAIALSLFILGSQNGPLPPPVDDAKKDTELFLKRAAASDPLKITNDIGATVTTDSGACVFWLKPDKDNDCHDNTTAASCAQDASDMNVRYSFYPGKQCSDIKY